MKDTISCSGFFFVDTAEIIAREQTFQNLCELVRGTHSSKRGNFRGEPLAWAKTDSLPQRLSVFSQTRLAGFKQWVAERAAGDYDAAAADRRLDETIAGAPVDSLASLAELSPLTEVTRELSLKGKLG